MEIRHVFFHTFWREHDLQIYIIELSGYIYGKKLVAILNVQSGGCMPQSTCRACAVKILKRWVQKIAGVPPLYSAYSLMVPCDGAMMNVTGHRRIALRFFD